MATEFPPDGELEAIQKALGEHQEGLTVDVIRPSPDPETPRPRLYVRTWQRMPTLGVSMMVAMENVG